MLAEVTHGGCVHRGQKRAEAEALDPPKVNIKGVEEDQQRNKEGAKPQT